jgi:hypothetical protein
LVLVLAVGACGGDDDDGDGGLGGGTTAPDGGGDGDDACEGVTLEASEVGVTPTEIRIAVAADTGSPLRPGLFQGSVDAVSGWADYVNANGGLACRQVVVEEYDTKLSADEAKNAVVGACGNSLALVGTTALFLNAAGMTEAEGCRDKAGRPTGLPDLAVLQTEPAQQCSPVSFVILGGNASCPYSGSGPRTYVEVVGPYRYYLEEYGEDALHGVWVIPQDLPSTISASMPGFRVSQQLGIGLDYETGLSGLSEQPAYTPVVQEIKDNTSTYARVGLDYKGTVFLRKEAEVQGVDSVLVWDCSVQCYDRRLITEGGSAVEDQYTWIFHLPFEDAGANDTLDAFLEHVDEPDSFGAQAWAAAELFRHVVEQIVDDAGPNAITRAAVLETLATVDDFDAGGLIPPTDVGEGTSSGGGCFVLMQVQGGEFVRVLPTEEGTFHCPDADERLQEITIDPVAEFQG